MNNPFSLSGKTIFVTGASSGLGRGIAVECSKMGAKLLLTARNKERLQETLSMLEGEGHSFIAADLSKEDELSALIEQASVIDGLVNCAGMLQLIPVAHINRENLTQIMDVNSFAPILLTTALLRKKKLKRGSSIVFIESIAGVYIAETGGTSYATSKGALYGFIKGAGIDLGAKGIRVNGVCPGLVKTNIVNMASEMFSAEDVDNNLRKYPLKRLGTPEDIAYGVIYLLSDASSWVTGVNLPIDGGRVLL